MPASVLVWDYRGPGHPGHASLEIRHGGREVYCSWWPTDDKAKKLAKSKTGGLVPPWKARGVRGDRTLLDDELAECGINGRLTDREFDEREIRLRDGQRRLMDEYDDGTLKVAQAPQHRIELPGDGEGGAAAGLDLERMIACWTMLSINPRRQYRFISKEFNCASVAAALLLVGGGGFFSEMVTGTRPDLGRIYLQPNNVRDWANGIRDGIATARGAGGVAGPTAGMPSIDGTGRSEIMDLAEWKRISHVKAGWSTGLALRGGQIARIDELLRDYHALAWDWADMAGCAGKLRLMGRMVREVYSHLSEKAGSDRRAAVVTLGAQLLARYRYVAGRFCFHFQGVSPLPTLHAIQREIHGEVVLR